jgi:hypothetical protein
MSVIGITHLPFVISAGFFANAAAFYAIPAYFQAKNLINFDLALRNDAITDTK